MTQDQMPAWMRDLPKTVDEAWIRLQNFLDHLPNDIERQKAIRVLRRRLAHPEMAPGTLAYGEREIERENAVGHSRAKPPYDSGPPCVCGASFGRHDPLTSEYPKNGCTGFYPEPV